MYTNSLYNCLTMDLIDVWLFCLQCSSQENVLSLQSTRATAPNSVEQMLIVWETTSVVTTVVELSVCVHNSPPQLRRYRQPLRLCKKKVYKYLLTER